MSVFYQAIRFGIVGLVGTGLNYAVFCVLLNFGNIHYILAGAAGFVSAIPPVYLANRKWTFQSNVSSYKGLISYALVCLVGLGVHLFIQWVSVRFFGVKEIFSQLVGIWGSAITNFVLSKFLVFSD